MTYRVSGLDPAPFRHLYGQSNAALAAHGVRRMAADASPGFPDRIELRDVAIGENVLLLNHTHLDADSPYRASHAIFVREGAMEAYDRTGEIPDPLRRRPISLRAFDASHDMVDAALTEGEALEPEILRLLRNADVDYVHAHYAIRGCYAALIRRAA